MADIPITVTVRRFREISGLGKTSVYALLKDGKLESCMMAGRRLIIMDSYIRLLGTEVATDRIGSLQTADK